jgi:hypothetical protein
MDTDNEKWNDPYVCFWELYNSWHKDEAIYYCECFEVDENPDDIPTDLLLSSHYKCLRVLEDYFETHFNGEE